MAWPPPKFHPHSSVCMVAYNRSGTGSLVKLHFSNGTRTFFMAPFQKVPISNEGDIGALKLSCEDKKFVNMKLELVKRLWIYQNDQQNAGLKLIYEDKKFVVLEPIWVNNLWIKSNYEMNITVIEFESEMEMFAPTNFKPIPAGSTITGEKNALSINTILEAYQKDLSKCDGQMHEKPDGLIPPQYLICHVEYSKSGTGSVVRMEFPKKPDKQPGIMRDLFITSFHVVQICQPDEVTGLKLNFGDKTIGNVNLTPDWVKMMWFSLDIAMDVCIIELSPIAKQVLSRTKFVSLLPTSERPVNGDSVLVYQYPEGEFAVAYGKIHYSQKEKIKYLVDTDYGSSGAPVLNERSCVLAIHCGKEDKGPGIAIDILEITKAYEEYLSKHYGGEKEIWKKSQLEWIEHLPKNALQLMGTGGYGKVYKAIVGGGISYAVKIIEGFGGLDKYKSQVASLSTEYQVITALPNHDRKILLHSFFQDDQNAKFFIIMEYLEGGCLFDKIKNYGRLNKTCSLKYLVEILEGLEFLHQQNVSHNDLKPENILFTANDHIKLCDTGISIHIQTDSSVTSPHLRQDCYYMSPERINGERPSAVSDIWSLGVTFVMMLTGHTINHADRFPTVNHLLAEYNISIDGVALVDFLKPLIENDYRKMIISGTLCPLDNRKTAHDLLDLVQSIRGPPELGTIPHAHENMPAAPSASSPATTKSKLPEFKAWILRSVPGTPFEKSKFKQSNTELDVRIVGMVRGKPDDELFIADVENRAVRSFNVTAAPTDVPSETPEKLPVYKLNLHLVYRMCEGENLKDIAYSSENDTLLVVSSDPNKQLITIRSFARTPSEWRQCCSHTMKSKAQENRCTLRALSDGRLVFGVWGAILVPADSRSRSQQPTKTTRQEAAAACHKESKLGDELQVLTLTRDNSRKIQEKTCIKLPASHSGFDAKLVGNRGEMWVAAALWFDAVALFRVVGDRVEELFRFKCECPQLPLFYGDNLLVCRWPSLTPSTSADVLELSITEGQIKLLRTLSDLTNYWWTAWCVVPNGLAAYGYETGKLTLYSNF